MAEDHRQSEKHEPEKSEKKPPRPEKGKGLSQERSSRIPDSEPPKEKRIDDL